MGARAPYLSVTGFQISVVRKASLKWEKAGHEPLMRVMATPPSSARTTSAAARVAPRKIRSRSRCPAACRGSIAATVFIADGTLQEVTNRRPLWCRAAAGLSILPHGRRPGAGAAAPYIRFAAAGAASDRAGTPL